MNKTQYRNETHKQNETWLDGLFHRLNELCCYYEGLIYESISQMLVFNILILWHLRNTVVIPTKSYSLQNDISIVLTFQGGRSGRWNIFLWHLFIFMYGHPLLIQNCCLTMHWCSRAVHWACSPYPWGFKPPTWQCQRFNPLLHYTFLQYTKHLWFINIIYNN